MQVLDNAAELHKVSVAYSESAGTARALKERVKVLKKVVKKETKIEVKNVTRGTYNGCHTKGTLKRDGRFVLLLLNSAWHVVTWAAKTEQGGYVVQVLPEAAKESTGLFRDMLKRFPPTSRRWLLIDELTVPLNCENVVLTKNTASEMKGLYEKYEAAAPIPKSKGIPHNFKKYRKGR